MERLPVGFFHLDGIFWKGATVETVGRAVVVGGWGGEAGLGGAQGCWGERTWCEAVMVESLCSGLRGGLSTPGEAARWQPRALQLWCLAW